MSRPNKWAMAQAAAVALVVAAGVHAQGFPTKPIKLVSGTTPGSASDTIGRAIVDRMTANVGQPVIVENRTGGGGLVAIQHVMKSEPDGYTLNLQTAAITTAALMAPQPFDPNKEMTPVATVAVLPTVLVVNPSKGIKTVADLVAQAKANPGKLNYVTVGVGSSTWMNAEKLRASAGLDMVHIPVRGSPEAITEVLTGRADFFFAPIFSAVPQMKEGKLVGIAVGSPKRSAMVPDLPTTVEAGYPNSDYFFWVGFLGPKNMPADVVKRLNDEVTKAVQSTDVRERLTKLGADPVTMTPGELGALIKNEYEDNARLMKTLGIKPNH